MIYNVDENGVFGHYGRKACLEIQSEYSEWFEHAHKVSHAAHSFLSRFKPCQRDTPAMLITTLFVRGLSQYQGVILLCQYGLTNEARVVLRSLVELVVSLRAIHADDEFARDYVIKHERLRCHLLKVATQSDFLREQSWEFDLDEERGRIFESLGADKKGPSLAKYAHAAGMSEVYYTLYTVLCGSVHSGVKDLEMHLDNDKPDKVKKILYGVSDDEMDFLLYTASEMIVFAVNAAVERFSVEFSVEFEELLKEHARLGTKIIERS